MKNRPSTLLLSLFILVGVGSTSARAQEPGCLAEVREKSKALSDDRVYESLALENESAFLKIYLLHLRFVRALALNPRKKAMISAAENYREILKVMSAGEAEDSANALAVKAFESEPMKLASLSAVFPMLSTYSERFKDDDSRSWKFDRGDAAFFALQAALETKLATDTPEMQKMFGPFRPVKMTKELTAKKQAKPMQPEIDQVATRLNGLDVKLEKIRAEVATWVDSSTACQTEEICVQCAEGVKSKLDPMEIFIEGVRERWLEKNGIRSLRGSVVYKPLLRDIAAPANPQSEPSGSANSGSGSNGEKVHTSKVKQPPADNKSRVAPIQSTDTHKLKISAQVIDRAAQINADTGRIILSTRDFFEARVGCAVHLVANALGIPAVEKQDLVEALFALNVEAQERSGDDRLIPFVDMSSVSRLSPEIARQLESECLADVGAGATENRLRAIVGKAWALSVKKRKAKKILSHCVDSRAYLMAEYLLRGSLDEEKAEEFCFNGTHAEADLKKLIRTIHHISVDVNAGMKP